jgi:hypothetical protein
VAHHLEDFFRTTIEAGLLRSGLKKCSDWGERYLILPDSVTKEPKPLSFEYWPWSREMHDSEAFINFGMKAAQLAYTNTVLHRSFFEVDMLGHSVLYVLPNTNPDASDFSASRFDMMLELSDHLKNLFSDTRNIGHKRAGTRNMWIRGSRSTSGLKNIDPSFIVLDEFDEMDMGKVELALRRADGQWSSRLWCISTPTFPEKGIHSLFLESTQEHWTFKCPKCSRRIELIYPDCLVVTSDDMYSEELKKTHTICPDCKETERMARGFHVNQLSSCVKPPWKFAQTVLKARYSKAAEQELWNSLCGLPHIVDGAKLTEAEVSACQVDRKMSDKFKPTRLRTMGVDIGKVFHYEIGGWHIDRMGPDVNLNSFCEVLKVGLADGFHEISMLMRQYQINMCVVDWQNEERLAYQFCLDHMGHSYRCQYASGQGGKRLTIIKPKNECKIHVHRTHWADLALGRVRTKRIAIPQDVPKDYKIQLTNLVKYFKAEDKAEISRDLSEYRREGPDHYAHARIYNEIAFPLAASIASNQNIRSLV